MAKTRSQKAEQLEKLQSVASGKAIVFTRYAGLTVRDVTDLRRTLGEQGMSYIVTKNTLLVKALSEQGIELPETIAREPLAIVTSPTDEVEPCKIIVKFRSQHEPLQILGAVIDGKLVDATQVSALAALPSRDELYARVVGSLNAPISGLVNVMAGNLRGLVSVLKQYQEKLPA